MPRSRAVSGHPVGITYLRFRVTGRTDGRAPKESGWQEDDGPQQAEYPFRYDPEQTEGDRQQPDERPKQQSRQRQWPAEYQQNQPKQHSDHEVKLTLLQSVMQELRQGWHLTCRSGSSRIFTRVTSLIVRGRFQEATR